MKLGFAFQEEIHIVTNMKWLLLFKSFLVGGTLCAGASTLEKDFTVEQVVEALGKPMGIIELSDKTLYLYPQGEVTMTAELVSDFELMETEEFQAEQKRRRIEREEWQADQEKRAAMRLEAGQALKAEKMQSRAFASLPAKDQVDYWRSFQRRFPSVDISEQLATALLGYEMELAELRSQERISDLETRVAQAEREAAAARLETEKLRKETEQLRNRSRYNLRHYTNPVLHPRPYHYRPPTVTIHSNGTTTTTRKRRGSNVFFFQRGSKPAGTTE
jgi:hypothetical protein